MDSHIAKKTSAFYDDHWKDFPLNLEGVVSHLKSLFPEGVKGKKVLDAGCESGIISIAFASMGAEVLGVDASPKCVENSLLRAQRYSIKADFERHDLTALNLGDRSFDIIYSWGGASSYIRCKKKF